MGREAFCGSVRAKHGSTAATVLYVELPGVRYSTNRDTGKAWSACGWLGPGKNSMTETWWDEIRCHLTRSCPLIEPKPLTEGLQIFSVIDKPSSHQTPTDADFPETLLSKILATKTIVAFWILLQQA